MIRAKIEDDERNILFKVINGHSTESNNKFTNIENDVKSLEKKNRFGHIYCFINFKISLS